VNSHKSQIRFLWYRTTSAEFCSEHVALKVTTNMQVTTIDLIYNDSS